MSAAACLFAAFTASLSLPSTSAPTSSGRRSVRIPTALLRCSPTRRRGQPVRVRALDERLLEAAPAETEEVQTGVDVGDGGGVAEGDGVGAEEELELEQQRPSPRAFVKSRRQRQEEEEAAAGQDRFRLINGKEVRSCLCTFTCFAFCGLAGLVDRLSRFQLTAACAKSDHLICNDPSN